MFCFFSSDSAVPIRCSVKSNWGCLVCPTPKRIKKVNFVSCDFIWFQKSQDDGLCRLWCPLGQCIYHEPCEMLTNSTSNWITKARIFNSHAAWMTWIKSSVLSFRFISTNSPLFVLSNDMFSQHRAYFMEILNENFLWFTGCLCKHLVAVHSNINICYSNEQI